MVAPLSQASNNSTGMAGYTSSCGAGASTSAYVGTQQLAILPGCSSSGMGEIQRVTGGSKLGETMTFTLSADVDIHSEIHYTYDVVDQPGALGDMWGNLFGLKMIKDVTIKVGTSVWETIDQASMLAMAQLEMTGAEYTLWATGLNGLSNPPKSQSGTPADSALPSGGGKLMCCVKGGYRGQLFVAAMPYQSITVKISLNSVADCLDASTVTPPSPVETNFTLYTKQHILSPYERGLMQSTDILQLLGTTQYYTEPLTAAITELPSIDLSFFNDYCTHIAVWCTKGNSAIIGANASELLTNCEFVYNGTSAQGEQSSVLLERSSMLGLAGGGRGSLLVKISNTTLYQDQHIQLFQIANTPCVTSLSTSQSQFAPFAGGDGVSNNRYDVIQFNAHPIAPIPAGSHIHFVAFGAQSVLYSAGGAVKN